MQIVLISRCGLRDSAFQKIYGVGLWLQRQSRQKVIVVAEDPMHESGLVDSKGNIKKDSKLVLVVTEDGALTAEGRSKSRLIVSNSNQDKIYSHSPTNSLLIISFSPSPCHSGFNSSPMNAHSICV